MCGEKVRRAINICKYVFACKSGKTNENEAHPFSELLSPILHKLLTQSYTLTIREEKEFNSVCVLLDDGE